jgi:hypothetical protein
VTRRIELRFLVNWIEKSQNRSLEESATVAELEISVANANATLHFLNQTSVQKITIPVCSIAEGLALDWWRLFGSRDAEISLTRYRSGFALPDIRMNFDGAAFEVRSFQKLYVNPDVRFWGGPSQVLDRQEAESELTSFVDLVLGRLAAKGVNDTSAAMRWMRVQESRADPAEQKFCEAAAALGHDPYNIGDEATAAIEKAATVFQDEPLAEFLAGARGKDWNKLLAWIAQVREMPGYVARLADLPALAKSAAQEAPIRAGERGWELGYRRARTFRAALNLKDVDRVRSYKQLATKLGNANFRPKPAVDGIRVLREDDNRGVQLHLRKPNLAGSAPAELLFNLARGVGDVACFPEPAIAPINDLQQAYRQKSGRSFAAEFLAPVREVMSMQRDGRDFSSIAAEFGVSERVVEHQVENENRIETSCEN